MPGPLHPVATSLVKNLTGFSYFLKKRPYFYCSIISVSRSINLITLFGISNFEPFRVSKINELSWVNNKHNFGKHDINRNDMTLFFFCFKKK